jgi:hypothetical protein
VIAAATGVGAKVMPGKAGAAAGTAHEAAADLGAAKDLRSTAQDIGKKAETAALGTKGGARLAEAKPLDDDAAKKVADVESAKKAAQEAGKPEDSSDIEE